MSLDGAQQAKARRAQALRAFSFVEMLAVLAIIGLIAIAGIGRFGSGTLENLDAEAYGRRLALDLAHARQRTIATGDNHYLDLTTSGGEVTTYALVQRASGGDVVVDEPRVTPSGLTVIASHADLEFDFDGSALAGYVVVVSGPTQSWTLTATAATGSVELVDTSP